MIPINMIKNRAMQSRLGLGMQESLSHRNIISTRQKLRALSNISVTFWRQIPPMRHESPLVALFIQEIVIFMHPIWTTVA
jgi:hypothetical protein